MRRAFAACVAFAALMLFVVIRCGFRDSPPEPPPQRIVDAAIADAPVDAGAVVPDAAPAPKKKPAAKPKPKPTRPAPEPAPRFPPPEPAPPVPPTQETPGPTPTTPPTRGCTHPVNPVGCPMKEPNVNRPCDADGVHCIYGNSCCPFVYVCANGAFEAWFSSCP